MSNGISLTKLIPKENSLENRRIWVEFKGVQFQIRYISRATLLKLAEDNRLISFDPAAKTRRQGINAEKFVEALAKTIVHGWRNMTVRTLLALTPLELGDLSEAQLDEEVPFNEENLLVVIKNVHELDGFLQECATEAAHFRPQIAEEVEKNSLTTQSGSSTATTSTAKNVIASITPKGVTPPASDAQNRS